MTAQSDQPTASPSRTRIPPSAKTLNRSYGARPYQQPRQTVPVDQFDLDPPDRPGVVTSSATKSAMIVGLAYVLSRIFGILRDMLLGYRFGAGNQTDAYYAAFRIPDLVFLGVMSVAFGAAFIPVFGGFLAKGQREAAWKLANAVVVIAMAATVVISVIAFLLAGPLMRQVIAPELPAEVMPDAISTMRILLLSPILIGLGIAAKGMLEAQDLFTAPALAPVMYNLAIIVAIIVLAPSMGIEGVAIGAIVGAALHIGVQLPSLIRSGARFVPMRQPFQIDGVGEVLRLLGPRVIGQAAFQINFIWVTSLANRAGEGRVAAMNYSWQMLMLPHGLIALSISTVIFPRMARFYEEGKVRELRQVYTQALAPLLFLTLPASIGLYEFRTPIIMAIYQHGAFDAHDTALVSSALEFLALGLIFYGLVEVVTRIFYAMKDTRTPVIAGVLIIIVNMIIGYALLGPLGHIGLAIGLTASTALEAGILIVILRKRIGGLQPEFAAWFAKLLLAAAAMTLMGEYASRTLSKVLANPETGFLMGLILTGYAIAMVAATFFVAAWLLRLPEVTETIAKLRRLARRLP
ncbi:MAG TPA: murein biosynthesis integral membrane protein MurJ, partial [Thermomicrobiales bacterium]|nr:murein biosynthesis integral membrane protein MurJ [Thermomicrobiales bacterium]